MNRKVGTSDSSETDDNHREAEHVSEQGGSRVDPANEVPTLKDSQSKNSPGDDGRKKAGARSSARSAGGGAPGDVGQMLRGAYRQTVDEAIPDDLMDLLNKLE